MKIPIKKLKNGFSLPVFGIGSWQMGGRHERDFHNDDQADILAICNAIDSGIIHIDTAERYAGGHAEELVGDAISNYKRDKLFLVSKVWNTNLKYENVLTACSSSLKRLKTDYLDLYLVHLPNPDISIKETMKAMSKLKKEGLIKNIGLSDFNVERFKEAQSCCEDKIVVNQLHYNLIFREPERKGLVDFCRKNDVFLVAWRPVQYGMLTDISIPIMKEMCAKYHKTPSQIAINWLISQKNIVTISKMRKHEHLRENLGAVGWEMEVDDIERLRCEYPGQKDVSDSVPLI
ncbi:aldo/keto reductase [Candidatus Gottesmanbacteria bacterium]|nr:aldo/keto reductase [Candidatus Gottesmanbacteria bacterium]